MVQITPLSLNAFVNILGMALIQLMYFTSAVSTQQFSGVVLPFYTVNVVFHVLLLLLLWLLRKHFFFSESRIPMNRINFPNQLTLFRLSSLPTISFLFILTRDHYEQLFAPLMILTIVSFLTDLFDGFLSRKLKQVTDLGKVLDSGTDYLVIFILSIIFLAYGVIPLWLIGLIALRLALPALGALGLSIREKGLKPQTTIWGKISFFGIMVLYTLEIFVFLRVDPWGVNRLVLYLEWGMAAVLSIAILDKAAFFAKRFRSPRTS